MANVVITVTANNNTHGAFALLNHQLNQLHHNSNGLNGPLNGVNNLLINLNQNAGQAGGAIGEGAGGLSGGMYALIGGAVALLPALGALVPMIAGLGVAGLALKLTWKDLKKEAETLRGPLNDLKKAVEKTMMPGVKSFFKDLKGLLKDSQPIMRVVGQTLGDVAREAGKFANSPAFKSAFFQNVKMGMGFIKGISGSLLDFTQSLLDFGKASQPTLDAFTRGIGGLLSKGLPEFFNGLKIGIGGTGEMLNGFFDGLNKILGPLGKLIGVLDKELGPILGQIFIMLGDRLAAALNITAGALNLLTPVFKDIKFALKSINDLFEIFAPAIKDAGSAILNSFIPAGKSVDNVVGPFQRLNRWIQTNKSTIENASTAFANFIVDFVGAVIENLPKAIGMFRFFSDAVLGFFGGILHGADKAFGWIPGIGGKLHRATRDFDGFVKGWDKGLTAAQKKAESFSQNVGPKLRENKLKMDISQWKRYIEDAKQRLKTVPKEKQGKLKQDIKDWQHKITTAQGQLKNMKADKTGKLKADKHDFDSKLGSVNRSSIKSKTGRIRGDANSFWSTIGRVRGASIASKTVHIVASVVGAAKHLLGFAHGGIIGAAAGGGPRSNTTLVGENGPELVDLAPGSRVRSNPDSRRLASSGGGGSQVMQITLQIGDKKLGDLLIDPLRKSVRTRGGNVQAVLGG